MEIKDQIRIAREAAGMDRQQFADRLDVSRQSVLWWESGEHRPKMTRIKEIEDLLKIRLDLTERGNFRPLGGGIELPPALTPEIWKLAQDISMLPKAQRDAFVTLIQAHKNIALANSQDHQKEPTEKPASE